VNGPAQDQVHDQLASHAAEPVNEPVAAEPVHHQIESTCDPFSQYQHPSGLSFPQAATTAAPEQPTQIEHTDSID